MRKVLLLMIIFLVLASGCSLFSNTNTTIDGREGSILSFPLTFEESSPIDLFQMTQAEKIEKGIDLIYSPDRSSYYVPDNPYEFNSLVLGGKNEKTIFEYTEFFGSVFREFNEATVFWGGLSDGLYLVWRSGENLSGGIKLWFYDLQDEKWNEVDVSFCHRKEFILSLLLIIRRF